MGLADDLEKLETRKPGTFDAWLNMATEEDRAIVLRYVADTTVEINPLIETLRRNGIPCTYARIRRARAENA